MAAIVTGAGTSTANGVYVKVRDSRYEKEDGHLMYYSEWWFPWYIGSPSGPTLYYYRGLSADPPFSGWERKPGGGGIDPAPQVQVFASKDDAVKSYQASLRAHLENEKTETTAKAEASTAELRPQLDQDNTEPVLETKPYQLQDELAAARKCAEAAEASVAELRAQLEKEKTEAMPKAEAYQLQDELAAARKRTEVLQSCVHSWRGKRPRRCSRRKPVLQNCARSWRGKRPRRWPRRRPTLQNCVYSWSD